MPDRWSSIQDKWMDLLLVLPVRCLLLKATFYQNHRRIGYCLAWDRYPVHHEDTFTGFAQDGVQRTCQRATYPKLSGRNRASRFALVVTIVFQMQIPNEVLSMIDEDFGKGHFELLSLVQKDVPASIWYSLYEKTYQDTNSTASMQRLFRSLLNSRCYDSECDCP